MRSFTIPCAALFCATGAGAAQGFTDAAPAAGRMDPQRDEGEAYAARLRDARASVTLTRDPGTIHGFFQVPGVLDAGRRVIDESAAALRAAFQAAEAR